MALTLRPTDSEARVEASRRRTQRLIEDYAADSPVHQMLNPGDTIKEGLSITGNLVGTALLPAYEKTVGALGFRPENELPKAAPVSVKPLNPEKSRPLLEYLYGPKGEHWQEGMTEMLSSPGGLQRFLKWKEMIQKDPDYAPRYAELKSSIDDKQAFWNTVIDEYKQARKSDAELSTESLAGNTALNVALFAIPGALTYSGARAAGAGRMLAAQTAVTGEVMAPIELGKLALSAPAQLLRRPRLLGLPAAGAAAGYAATGDARGAAEGAFFGALIGAGSGARAIYRQAHGMPGGLLDDVARWAKRTEDAIPGPKLELSQLGWGPGKVRPSVGNFAEAANVTPGFAMPPAVATAGLGALYGGLTEGVKGAVMGGVLGGVAGKFAPKYPGPVIGGIVGGAAAANNNDGDPWGTLVGAGIGAGLGGLAQRGMSPANLRSLVYAESAAPGAPRDLRAWASFMGHLMPEADWRRVELFAKYLYPVLDEQDKLLDAARATMRKNVITAVGGEQALNDDRQMTQIYDALEGLGRRGRVLPAPAATERQGAALGLVHALQAGERGGVERATLAKAVKVRRVLDKWFDDAVDAGLIDEKAYVEGYVPRILDEKVFWNEAGKTIRSREDVRGLDTGLRKLFAEIDGRKVLTTEEHARDAYLNNPVKFVRHLRDGKIGVTKEEAEQLLGGAHRWQQLDDVNALAEKMHIYPSTVIKIVRGGRAEKGAEAGLMMGGQIKGDWIPKALVDEFRLERTGAELPIIKHLPTVLDRYIERTTRRRYYDPLLREWNSLEEPGLFVYRGAQVREPVLDPAAGAMVPYGKEARGIIDLVPHKSELQEARLKPLHDALVGDDLPRLSKIARKLVNSRLGVPSETDAWIEDAIFNFMRRNPAKYREATRLVLDMQYSGAIGLNPAKAARNSFQSLLTATGVGPGHMAMGMREVARREKTITAMAEKYGALGHPSIDAFNTAKIAGNTPMRRMWNHYVDSAFELFHAADRRNRLWAFAAGQRRALLEYEEIAAKGADAPALQIFRPEQRQRFAAWAADANVTKDEFAGRYGAALSDLTQWVYGKRGSPLATRNVLGANLGIFTSWPANYISLMYEWAANGQIGKIINLSLGAAILDRVGEEAGVGRMTGFTSDQEGALKVLPTGPIPDRMPGVGSPTMKLIPQAARLGKEAFKGLTGGEPDFNPYRYHALSLFVPAGPQIERLGEAGLTQDPEVTMRRLTGISQPKDR